MYFDPLILWLSHTILFQWLFSETGIAGALRHHVLFIRCEIDGSKRRQGNLVENKEQHFHEVAKEKYTRICVCLTIKTTDLKCFMLRFILKDYGDNHHLRTTDISPENIGIIVCFITVTVPCVVSNCFHSSVVTFLACKVTYKIVFLCNLYKISWQPKFMIWQPKFFH